ncbi:c-type cytochrome [Sulfitobacter sp. S190]|uniref:c-type cytochrome n=1 Tax=Sulfitobacter sp. S190 TaxID=2867022 RepID=UPI0021A6C527|nr:c-type cytochrome [Sulfitobacter sp. S190]UWR21170.1 c-type cytochrome [Sulfitobacter sp. S190]
MLKPAVLSIVLALFAAGALADSDAETAGLPSAQEIDVEAAQKIFQKSCRACHGNKAQGAASYPALADKSPEYIAEKLRIYRSGEKIGPNSILMISHAKKLSDEDIANISVYVATAFD